MVRLWGFPLLALASLGLVFYLNSLMVEVQWEEMDRLLAQSSGEEAVLESASLWGRLELVKNRLRYGETPVENYVMEARIQALTASISEAPSLRESTWKSVVVNQLRQVFGRQLLINHDQEAVFTAIEQAYFFEKTRKYVQASDIYSGIEKTQKNIPSNIRLRIQLHLGFCLALSGNKEDSLQVFKGIVRDYPKSDGGVLASLLVDFLTKLEELRQATLAQAPNPGQVKEAYFSMDYKKAIEYFDRLPVKEDPQARYYRGRAEEELGNLNESQAEYRRVIFLDSEGPWGQEARRRLVMQDKVYDQKSELTKRAAEELAARGDKNFVKSLESYPGYRPPPQDPFKLPAVSGGELYVDTTVPGAEISLNGVVVGKSPLFITEVPVGNLLVTARLGKRRGQATLEMEDRSIKRLNIDLPQVFGSLNISTPHTVQSVYLDEKALDSLDKIAPGKHSLLIQAKKSTGEIILWEKEVTISEGETLNVEVP